MESTNHVKEGDKKGPCITSLAAAIPKGMDVLQGHSQFSTTIFFCKVRISSTIRGVLFLEDLVRTVLAHFAEYTAEAELYERWLSNRDNPDLRDALAVLQCKIAMINSWLSLLNADELFVVQKHLLEGLEWPRVAFEFSERWKNVFIRSERSLGKYQASAMKKIVAFCDAHKEIMFALFDDLIEIKH